MEFPLVRSRQWRRGDTWEALFGLAVLCGGGYWVVRGSITTPNPWLRLAIVIGGVALLALFGGAAWSEMKEIFGRPGRIQLSSSEIVLDSPRWFRKPLRVPLSQVRLVTIDESGGAERRFPIAGAGRLSAKNDRDAWLWRKGQEGALPNLNLNPLDEVPNLAIVFDPPAEITAQKTLKTFLTHVASFISRRIRVVTALVDNPVGAKAAFDQLGLLRTPTQHDVSALQLSPEEKRQARRYNIISATVLVITVGAWIGGAIWYVASGD